MVKNAKFKPRAVSLSNDSSLLVILVDILLALSLNRSHYSRSARAKSPKKFRKGESFESKTAQVALVSQNVG